MTNDCSMYSLRYLINAPQAIDAAHMTVFFIIILHGACLLMIYD